MTGHPVAATSSDVTTSSVILTDSQHSTDESHSLSTQLAVICVFVVLSVVGILGNSFSIFLLTGKRFGRSRRILSPTYRVYIIALAIADNGMLFFTGILRYAVVDLMYETNQSLWFYEVYLCRWHRLLMHASHNAAVWLLVVMAIDRFIAVSFPFKYREIKHDPTKAIKVTSIVLILSFLFATPYLAVGPATSKQALPKREGSDFFNSSHSNTTTPFLHGIESTPSILYQLTSSSHVGNTSNFQEDNNLESNVIGCSLTATLDEKWAYAINIAFHVLLAFLIPYFVLLALNIFTLRCLHYQSSEAGSSSTWRQTMNRRITTMMLVVCFTFIILWLPQALLLLTRSDAHSHNANKNELANSLAALSGLTNSALNFGLYCLTVEKFRITALLYLKRLFCCSKKRTLWSSSSDSTIKGSWPTARGRRKKDNFRNPRSEYLPEMDRLSAKFRKSSTSRSVDYKNTDIRSERADAPTEQLLFMKQDDEKSFSYLPNNNVN